MALAAKLDAEIISFDSIKVYRGMDIGTDKPTADEMRRFRYHLVNICAPSESMNAGEFVRRAEEAVLDVRGRRRLPIIEGGTAMYLKAFIWGISEGPARDDEYRRQLYERASAAGAEALHAELAALDPERAAQVSPRDLKRLVRALEIAHLTGIRPSELRSQWASPATRAGYQFLLIGLTRSRSELYRRIDQRIERMMQNGLLDEVAAIWQADGFSRTSGEAIGYRQLIDHLEGRSELAEAIRRIKKATRTFARRQEAWFKRFPGVQWLRAHGNELPLDDALRCIRAAGLVSGKRELDAPR